MTSLIEIQEKLLSTTEAVAQAEHEIAADPGSTSLSLTLSSLRHRQQSLERQFAEAASQLGLDVCAYRLRQDSEAVPLATVGEALVRFQTLLSAVYASVKTGERRLKLNLAKDLREASTLSFGYSFSGSLGFALTIPNERLLVDESVLDESMETVFTLARARTSTEVAELAKNLGPAPIRAVYLWSKLLSDAQLGADVEWRRDLAVRAEFSAEADQLRDLAAVIEASSAAEESDVSLIANLVGFDVERRTFHIRIDEASDMMGVIDETASVPGEVSVPGEYRAAVRTRRQTQYSTGKVTETHHLLSLTDL